MVDPPSLRICIAIGPANGLGGPQVARSLACELAARGHEVVLLGGGLGPDLPWTPPPPPVRFVDLDLRSAPVEERARRTWEWLAENPQDVFYLNLDRDMEACLPYLPESTRAYYGIHALRLGEHLAGSTYIDSIDLLVCVSNAVAQQVRHRWRVPEEKIAVLHNGLRFPELPRRRAPARHEPIRLLFAGRFDALKGIYDLPRIAHSLRQRGVAFEMSLYGATEPADELLRQFERAGAVDSARIGAMIPNERIYEVLRENDVILLPSRIEALPTVLLEAMSMGVVPVLYGGVGGGDEIVTTGETGFAVPLGDVGAMAERVAVLAADRALLSRMGTRCAEVARARFSCERMTDNFLALVRRTTDDHSRSVKRLPGPPRPEAQAVRAWWHGAYLALPQGLRDFARRAVARRAGLAHWLWRNA